MTVSLLSSKVHVRPHVVELLVLYTLYYNFRGRGHWHRHEKAVEYENQDDIDTDDEIDHGKLQDGKAFKTNYKPGMVSPHYHMI